MRWSVFFFVFFSFFFPFKLDFRARASENDLLSDEKCLEWLIVEIN